MLGMVKYNKKDDETRQALDTIASLIRRYTNGVYFKIYVIPRAKESKLVFSDGEFLFYVNENCKHHRVNYAVLRFFNRIFGTRVKMLRGWSDRVKIIGVEGLSVSEAAEILIKHLHHK
jgi:uncharacterized protein YggU (UPF0235/DUF167 family)